MPSITVLANAPIKPATAAEKTMSLFLPSACAMPTPMPTPMSDLATFASVMTIFAKALSPSQPAICARIVPAISVTNKP